MPTFRDTPAPRWARWARGSLALSAGWLLVGLLTLAHTAAWLLPNPSTAASPAAPSLAPPHIHLLAEWLAPAAADTAAIHSQRLDALLGRAASAASSTRCRAMWSPPRTAVAGTAYRSLLPSSEGCAYRLLEAPPGLVLDDHAAVLRWSPTQQEAHWRAYPVVLDAIDPQGTGTRYRFDLFVTERPHWLGTDRHGRDVALALLYGSRWALLPGLLAVTLAVLLGSILGSLAGYRSGLADRLLRAALRGAVAVPTFVLLFVVAVTQSASVERLAVVMATLGLLWVPGLADEVRARVRALRDQQFIEAAHELGVPTWRVLTIDILAFQARDLLVRRAMHGLALALLTETALSFLGLGVIPPDVSWGTMIYEGRTLARTGHYALLALPTLALTLACSGFVLLDHGLRMRHAARPA